MPLGDSITYGIGSPTTSGYRAPLWEKLHGRAKSLDFVGSQQSGQLPDRDNEGHSGAMISQIAGAANSSVPLMRPNVVTLHAGTNDMDRGDPAAAPDRLDGLIGQILDDAPDTTVLVATLVPSRNETTQARITGFNKEIRALVAERQGAGQRVGLVDMRAVTTADLADYLHPNDTGYAKMADAFHRGIAAAVHDGWVKEPAGGGNGGCSDTSNRWEERKKIAQGGIHAPARDEIRFADIDGDGRDDYLVVNHETGAVDAWLNRGGDRNGIPGWEERGQIAQGGIHDPERDEIRFADVDGDGRDDYLVMDYKTGAVDAWLNRGGDRNGIPGWEERGQIAQGGIHRSGHDIVRFADVDGDGRDDYLVVNHETGAVDAWLNRGGDRNGIPGWEERGQIAQGGIHDPERDVIRFADIDCDPRDDYLVVNHETGAVDAWLNRGGDRNGIPGWEERGQIASGIGGSGPEFADLDGDGRDDYLQVDPMTGAVDAWLNRGGDPA
nr:GDSL-type esterase/lipase family protein [Streptomyces taklimakanensis]